jgi:hypothetical protein
VPYLTPDTAPGTSRCRVLLIPDDKTWLALVMGALSELTHEYNWEEFGTASIADTVDKFHEMLQAFEDCETCAMSDLVVVQEQQASGTNGGTFSSGAYRTRTLNTEVLDSAGIASLSANQVTLPAGTYRAKAWAECYKVDQHNLRLQNITNSTTLIKGSTCYAGSGTAQSSHGHLSGEFTLSAQSAIELQHRCATSFSTYGFGLASSQDTEVYANLTIERIA